MGISSVVQSRLTRGLTYCSTASAITSPSATTTTPATVDSATPAANLCVFSCAYPWVNLRFFGTDAADEAFTAEITGWQKSVTSGSTDLWVPVKLFGITCTLGTGVGVAAASVADTELMVDTIAVDSTSMNNHTEYEVRSPANNLIAELRFRVLNYIRIDVRFAKGTAASCNLLASGDSWQP